MTDFDKKAREWDSNPLFLERAKTIAAEIQKQVKLTPDMRAMEYGAGTGLLSFELKDKFREIVMMDNSSEMVKVMQEKVEAAEAYTLKPLFFDIENSSYNYEKFDVIFTQMVLHHVLDLDLLFSRFAKLINKNGYLLIADLYKEDGTFHDETFHGHLGFEIEWLSEKLKKYGFNYISHNHCYTIKRIDENDSEKEFPIFLLIEKYE